MDDKEQCPDKVTFGNFVCCMKLTEKYTSRLCSSAIEHKECPRGYT